MRLLTGESSCPRPSDDCHKSPTMRSFDEIARILARVGRPMTVEQVARLCRSAERKLAQALPADMVERLIDAARKPRA